MRRLGMASADSAGRMQLRDGAEVIRPLRVQRSGQANDYTPQNAPA